MHITIGISGGNRMKKSIDVNNSSFAYTLNMLNFLLNNGLITKEEFNKIAYISAEHYGIEFYCV